MGLPIPDPVVVIFDSDADFQNNINQPDLIFHSFSIKANGKVVAVYTKPKK